MPLNRPRSGAVRWLAPASLLVPVLLLLYAGARWLDGRDGSHGPGGWWDLGHVAFLLSWLGFAAISVALAARAARPGRTHQRRAWPVAAGTAAVAGTAAFGWVTLTDLFSSLPDLPDPLRAAGPVLFLVGFATLLGVTARDADPRGWPAYPGLLVLALVAVSASLALLPVTAVLMLFALTPCRRPAERVRPSRVASP